MRSSYPSSPAVGAPEGASPSPPVGGWARYFGYDIFISFALGPAPRGSRPYASDLARRLRERGFTVFFSEDQAAVGDELDTTLQRALRSSRVLVVVANRGTLADPRWVRTEVEEYRRRRARGSIVPISVDGALHDPLLGMSSQPWLQHTGRIWIDETAESCASGRVSDAVVERLVTAPHAIRSLVWLRLVVVSMFLLILALALGAVFQRNQATEQRDQARRSLLTSAAQQSLLLTQEGRAGEGWDALVRALSDAQPEVDGTLPDGFLEAALTALVEDRRGPDLRFDERATPPPLREPGDVQPPVLAFSEDSRLVVAAAGRHVAIWDTSDGRRLTQVTLDFEPAILTFDAGSTVVVAQGRTAANATAATAGAAASAAAEELNDQAPSPPPPGPPRAVAIAVAGSEVVNLPLQLCRRWVPCIGSSREPSRLLPLSMLPSLSDLRASRWRADTSFIANSAANIHHSGVSQGRFHLLDLETPAGETESWLYDAQTGGALLLRFNLEDRPPGVIDSRNSYTLASAAPFLAAGGINSPWMKRYRIEPGEPNPRLSPAGAVRAPRAAATQNLALDRQGRLLQYQTWRYGTGTGVGIGRTAVIDFNVGAERWTRSEGEVVWGSRLIALQEDWGMTQVLNAATGATWFSTPGRPLALDQGEQRLVMWDRRQLARPEGAQPDWPALRLVEALPLRQFATDPRGPASPRSSCLATRDLRFLTLAERTDRIWNKNDFHRIVGAVASTGAGVAQAVALAASANVAQGSPPQRFNWDKSNWVLDGPEKESSIRLNGSDLISRVPELAAVTVQNMGTSDVIVNDSSDRAWRLVMLVAREGQGSLRDRCPGGASWQLHRKGNAKPQLQGCSSAEVTAPGDMPMPQFVTGPSAGSGDLLLAIPTDSCRYTVFDVASGSTVGSVTPVFSANVRIERLSATLLNIESTDWYGVTFSYQWQELGSAVIGPVFMLADRNSGLEEEASLVADASNEVEKRRQGKGDGKGTILPLPSLFRSPFDDFRDQERSPGSAGPTGDEISWSLAATDSELSLSTQGRLERVAVPPWGERLRAKLRAAVQRATRSSP